MTKTGFKQWLNELFNRPLPFNVSVNQKDFKVYKFTVDDEIYTGHFENMDSDYALEEYATYLDLDWLEYLETHQFWTFQFALGVNAGGKMDIVGGKNSISVFSTVLAIIKDFKKRTPNKMILEFSAAEPSRVKLYSTISKSLRLKFTTFRTENRITHFLVKL